MVDQPRPQIRLTVAPACTPYASVKDQATLYGPLAQEVKAVLMTAMLAILGLMPAAISTGVGSETQKPFSIVIISGLVTAVAVTLLVLPTVYRLLVRQVPMLAVEEDAILVETLI